MERVKVWDKEFESTITAEQLKQRVAELGKELSEEYAGRTPLIISVLNGSFMFTSDLMKEISIECEIEFVKASSYVGMSTTGQVKELIGLNKNIAGRDVILVEDIVDSGHTMNDIIKDLQKRNVNTLKICSLLFKPSNFKYNYPIDYIGFETPDKFLLGYGLDYDGLGRNLDHIYQLVEK